MSTKEMTKFCAVCGDKAKGYYNFNAITCDSCKAFFRRNANKFQLKCYFDGKCKIGILTRKLCKKCRLDKCFAIGMKKEWILTEEEKVWRNYRIQVNKKKRESIVKTGDNKEQAICKLEPRSSQFDDEDAKTTSFGVKIGDSERKEPNYSPDRTINRPFNDHNNTLTETEGLRLTELLYSISTMQESNCYSYRIYIKNPVIEKACSAWAVKCQEETHKIVKTFKKLTAFTGLCDNDQLALVKYGSVEAYIMRLILRYNFKAKHFRLVDDQLSCLILKMDLLREFRTNLFEAYDTFVTKFRPFWDFDPNVIHILTPIVLFNPNQPNLCNRDKVRTQQQIYTHLLQRYLQIKYQSEYESKEKIIGLIATLNDLRAVMSAHRNNYAKKDPTIVSPLLKELFDLPIPHSDSIPCMFRC